MSAAPTTTFRFDHSGLAAALRGELAILENLGVGAAEIDVVARGTRVQADHYVHDGGVSMSRLSQLLARGACIQVRSAGSYLARLPAYRAVLVALDLSPTSPVNLFLAPPGGVAFGRHVDAYDSLALQIIGRKRWLIGDDLEVPQGPGDGILVPAGVPHLVRAESCSVSISFERR